jgi:hypothetical protein
MEEVYPYHGHRAERTIVFGTRIMAQLIMHGDTLEFRAFFDPKLSRADLEIVLRNYLDELLKGQ